VGCRGGSDVSTGIGFPLFPASAGAVIMRPGTSAFTKGISVFRSRNRSSNRWSLRHLVVVVAAACVPLGVAAGPASAGAPPSEAKRETSFQIFDPDTTPAAEQQAIREKQKKITDHPLDDPVAETGRRAQLSGNTSGRPARPSGEITTQREKLSPPSEPDAAFVKECDEMDPMEVGYVKSRFQWCQNSVARDYVYQQPTRWGTMQMNLQYVGYGRDDGTRSAVIFIRPSRVAFFGPLYTPLTRVAVGIDCDGGAPGCESDRSVSMSMAEWQKAALTESWLRFEVSTNAAAVVAHDNPDAVGFYRFSLWFKDFEGRKHFQGEDLGPIGTRLQYRLRCDSADYFGEARTAACIFNDVFPHLQYFLTDENGQDTKYRKVAEHIRFAQDNPNSTFPPKAEGKLIPGKYTGDPKDPHLERIPTKGTKYDDGRHGQNSRAKDAACPLMDPPEADIVNPQCDEYPFASTAQGAAFGDFSVRWVPGEDNGSAGGILPHYYQDDRILYDEWDAFWVEIKDKPDPPQGARAPLVSAGPDVWGDEGSAIQLQGSVKARGTDNISVSWTWEPAEGTRPGEYAVDPGTDCTFSNPHVLDPTITCNDDGIVFATLSTTDPVNGTISDRAQVTLANVAPTVSFSSPKQWDLFRVGTPVTFDLPITDPGGNDTHSCQLGWDEGEGWDHLFTAQNRNCRQTHTFQHAGMYTVEVYVADDDGGTGSAEVMIVVYDPDEAKADINGSSPTPAGALGSQTGMGRTWAHYFGDYRPGGSVPFGEAKAWIDNADFKLEPSSMQWMVVTEDGKVASRGTGTVNGRAGYTWVVYGWDDCDGSNTGACRDLAGDSIRLVVWNSATGQKVYDHSPNSDEYDVDRISPTLMDSGGVTIQRKPR
jgi:hypothetical protein